jgi:hypothetical protein
MLVPATIEVVMGSPFCLTRAVGGPADVKRAVSEGTEMIRDLLDQPRRSDVRDPEVSFAQAPRATR